MITHPSTVELARAVAHWLGEIRAQLDERNAFLARVAINALGIIDREISQRGTAESALTPRLATLLGHPGDYDSLILELCERLRSGDMSTATPELLSILREDTLAKLAIDQPTYRHEGST